MMFDLGVSQRSGSRLECGVRDAKYTVVREGRGIPIEYAEIAVCGRSGRGTHKVTRQPRPVVHAGIQN